MRDFSELVLAGLTMTALLTFLTVEPPAGAPDRVSSALMGGGAHIAYATANHNAPTQPNRSLNSKEPSTAISPAPEQGEAKREAPPASGPFTVPFRTPATIDDIVEPVLEPMPSAKEITTDKMGDQQAGAESGFGDSRVPPLYDYDRMSPQSPASPEPNIPEANIQEANTLVPNEQPTTVLMFLEKPMSLETAPPPTAKYGDSRVPELAPTSALPTNTHVEIPPAQVAPATTEQAPVLNAPEVGAGDLPAQAKPEGPSMVVQPIAPSIAPAPVPAALVPAKAAQCPKCAIPPEDKARQLAEIKARKDETLREQIAEAKAKRTAERAAEAKRSAKSRDDGRPIEYVSMDGAAFPMLGSMTPFAKPLHVEDDIRSVKLRNAMSVAPQDPRWAGWVEQVRSQKDQMAMLRLADEIIDHNVVYRDGTQNIWRDVDWTLRAGGVCKDYAIAKLRLLTDAGFPEDALRIVSMTPRTPGHDYHVVVMVWMNSKTWVLDMNDKSGKGSVIPLGSFQGERGVVWSGNLHGAHEFSRRQAHQSDERRVINVRETSGDEPGEKPATTASTETVVMDGKPLRVQRTPGDFVRYVAN